MLFSQRMGYMPMKDVIQVEDMDIELRNSLWNAFLLYYVPQERYIRQTVTFNELCHKIWRMHFKKPTDEINKFTQEVVYDIKKYFFECRWFEVYDFIEFVANASEDDGHDDEFSTACNEIFVQELSGFRFVGAKLVPITNIQELACIDEAILNSKSYFDPVFVHLNTAVSLLANRESPDYRNSIKESISAVESLCAIICEEKTTLGKALKKLEAKTGKTLHPALIKSFDSLYGYTNDADGIRHALLEEAKLDFVDAKYMLVSCSAFINYLIANQR